MATRTVVKETRALDHLYDQTHITSAPADHNKLTFRALATQLDRVPDADHFFSELVHYPRAGFRPGRGKDNFLPKYIDPRWEPRLESDANADMIFGSERFKYDRRPIVKMGAFTQSGPQIVMYEVQQTQKNATMMQTHMPLKKTVGTQSMYRESEAQTMPYTPDFITKEAPEILTLRNLTYENGLPASLFEVQIIERTRQKRLFEKMLPPATDEFCFNVRAQLLESQEFKEWAERERQIIALQDKRLELVKQLIQERDARRSSKAEAKIERLRQKKAEEKDKVFALTQYQRIKTLRKMYVARMQALARLGGVKTKLGQTVAKYQDKSSNVYAPLTRMGNIPDSNTAKIEIQPSDLKSYPKLLQLERTLPAKVLRMVPDHLEIPSPKKVQPVVAALDHAMKTLNMQDVAVAGLTTEVSSPHSRKGEEDKKSPKRKKQDRAETPQMEEALPEEEERAQALLLLQRVLRGRALQNRMFEGKEKRLDLIHELRSAEQMMQNARPVDVDAKAKLEEQILDAEDQVFGSVTSSMLDNLSKELEKIQEMRRIDAMVKLAERDRRMRQAAEGGRRQAEERVRAREDEIFRQVMKDAHQGTIDSYLEEILCNSVEASAKKRALAEAKAQAAKINEVVDTLEKEGNQEGCVKELVQNFILPHAQREIIQRRISTESKRFIDAARDSLDLTMSDVEKSLGTTGGRSGPKKDDPISRIMR